jgi:shikimate kinase
MADKQIVYIIGFMGSGKTTVGKKLSGYLGWAYIDLDSLISSQEGKAISDIFSESGEKYFREIESQLLRNMPIEDDTVISVGGGAPCYNKNIEYMKARGLVVYLKKTPLQLLSRLSDDSGKRPLLKGLSENELLAYIREKLSEREIHYNLADIFITGMDIDIENLAGKIISVI